MSASIHSRSVNVSLALFQHYTFLLSLFDSFDLLHPFSLISVSSLPLSLPFISLISSSIAGSSKSKKNYTEEERRKFQERAHKAVQSHRLNAEAAQRTSKYYILNYVFLTNIL